MKVYELMNELAILPSGNEIEVGMCISIQELKTGDCVEDGVYSLRLEIADVEGSTLYVERPKILDKEEWIC